MIPHDLHNAAGSDFERVTFEAEYLEFGLWNIAHTDVVTGMATDGNRYTYRQRFEFTAPTNDGRPPKPNRATPAGDDLGFLQVVPSNVNADLLDMTDQFVLQAARAGVIASSHLHWTWRLQIPPVENDHPPAFYPFVLENKYIISTHEQLAGQVGCDPM